MDVVELGLFTGRRQHESFCRLPELYAARTMPASSRPHEWREGEPLDLPDAFAFEGASRSVERLLRDTDTVALLVLQDGAVRHERYALTGGREVPWISMSVAKSFVDVPLSAYVPVEPGSAYDGVSVEHVLQMSSGARWNEDYSDPESDVFRMGAALAGTGGSSLDRLVATAVREREPGALCRYNSGDTQALAAGRRLSDLMAEKLVEPLGFTSPSHWLLDAAGTEMAFAGLNATARDFARIGELYRNDGVWNGRQVVPRAWVRDSVTVRAAHLAPGQPVVGGHRIDMGYGYQWWLPDGDRGEFTAVGDYNQYVYVDPASRVTIVKLSANPRYGVSELESDNRDEETLAFLRAVARAAA